MSSDLLPKKHKKPEIHIPKIENYKPILDSVFQEVYDRHIPQPDNTPAYAMFKQSRMPDMYVDITYDLLLPLFGTNAKNLNEFNIVKDMQMIKLLQTAPEIIIRNLQYPYDVWHYITNANHPQFYTLQNKIPPEHIFTTPLCSENEMFAVKPNANFFMQQSINGKFDLGIAIMNGKNAAIVNLFER